MGKPRREARCSFAPEGKQICPDAPWGDDSGRQIGYARQEHGMKPSPAQFKLSLYQRIARHGPSYFTLEPADPPQRQCVRWRRQMFRGR
jgi:hypothetical protein